MKTYIRRTTLTSIALLLLLGGATTAFADQQGPQGQTNQTQTLSATEIGGVSNLGNQVYKVSGGQIAMAMVAGMTLDPTSTLDYNFMAKQTGLTTTGHASIHLTGTTGGVPVKVTGSFTISSSVPAAVLPIGCATNCQSELPFFFTATSSDVKITIGTTTSTVAETMSIESPYFNPFGAPIVMASADNSIIIAATYTQGTIDWTGTQVAASIVGTLNTAQASGMVTMTTSETENLVKGTAVDTGSIQFSSMTPSSLNSQGTFHGTSTIPTAGSFDCSAATGMPGTCTETGFQSTGKFSMGSNQQGDNQGNHQDSQTTGSYSTSWGVPALGFSSTVSATVGQQ